MIFKSIFDPKKEDGAAVLNNLRKKELMSDMEKTRQAMEAAYANFDNVTDPDLIDCYIYEVNAVMKRYKYLIEQAEKLDSPPAQVISDSSREKSAAASTVI